jgi:iron complex outermembrane recepter protein
MRIMSRRMGLVITTALVSVAASHGAQAQEAAATTAAEPEVIVVTGSRIATRAINSAQPVSTITAESLALQGTVNIADQLDQMPALLGSQSQAQAAAFEGAAATLNLRNMGSARTLVLVDGKRHVAGVPGSASVNLNSIPSELIERVEVLTGGASAVYGSDAVTGVVNFITRQDFEGARSTLQLGLSGQGDGEEFSFSQVFGANFGPNNAGNVTLSFQASSTATVEYGDRDFGANNGIANDYDNPARRFQAGDPLPPGRTAQNTLGLLILNSAGTAPRFAGTAQSLVDRATSAKSRMYRTDPRFAISSTMGTIGLSPTGFGFFAGGNGDFSSAALNTDCSQSWGGSYRGLNFAVGCWVIDPTSGQLRPFRDGVFAGSSNQFGGDGAAESFNSASLAPSTDTFSGQINARYRVNEQFEPYLSFKIASSDVRTLNPYNSFDDNIIIALDNPFIPASVQSLINAEIAAGGSVANVTIARDNIDIYNPEAVNISTTFRTVVGFEGSIFDDFKYDVSFNYGVTEGRTTSSFRLEDRYFAAIDAVRAPGPNGQIVCRSSLNPAALPRRSGLYGDAFAPVPLTTFSATDGTCVPLNLFGANAPSAAARAFQDYRATDNFTIDQAVLNATLVGNSAQWFSLPGGPISFAVGAEYRKETSEFIADPFKRDGLVFNFATTADVTGEYEVSEAFAEIALPILADLPFAEVLTVTLAGRASDYSISGKAETWKVDAIWAPIADIRFRGGVAVAVRAPNISELFSPRESATFRPIDPCDAGQIGLGPRPANRLANCRADGIPVGFVDPLTARFVGETGGNPNLTPETADTFTYGLAIRPRFLPGFTATVDYWNIKIENAISAVSAQNIVNACYDSASIAGNPFCQLFRRNRTTGSPTFLGFNYLLQSQVNFASLEASGTDFDVSYRLDLADIGLSEAAGSVRFNVAGTVTEDRRNFEVVTDPTAPNPELKELNNPELALSTTVQWNVSDFTVGLYSTMLSTQYLSGIEVENLASFADPVETGDTWIHDASVRWKYSDDANFTFGVQNLTDVEPYFVSVATPVSGVGRFFFIRASVSY